MTEWERQHLPDELLPVAERLRDHRVDVDLDRVLASSRARATASDTPRPRNTGGILLRPRTVLSFILVSLFALSAGAATLSVSGEFSSSKEGSAAKHQYQPPGCDRGKGRKKGCDPKPCKGRGKRSYSKGRRCHVSGSSRNDRLRGTSHSDRVRAGRGNDRINVRGGGRDYVRCGPGRDTVVADKRDRVSKDCERVIRR